MQDACAPFAGKRITMLGLGVLGRAAGDAAFFAECDAEVLVTDKKSEAELQESVDRLRTYPNVRFRLGGHEVSDFTSCDLVIKAAGVPLDSPFVAAAKEAGVPVRMSTALAAERAREAGATIVGVTGTRGKSTVTHMIYQALVQAGTGRRAHLGGNIRGVSTLALLSQIEKDDVLVLELDSWQLQGFGDLQMSPHVAVFTNLKFDHLNYYPDMETYFQDKANIFKFQKPGDVFISSSQVESMWIRDRYPSANPKIPGPFTGTLQLIGEHNLENAAFAAEALRALDVPEGEIQMGLSSFKPVEGRLQLVREVHGVKIYNDNNATTPDATMAAIAALTPTYDGKIVLIMGGADKGLDVRQLIALTNEPKGPVFAHILLPGTGTEKISRIITKESKPVQSMAEAVQVALAVAQEIGGVVLFSPAFASFGMFKNEYDRNDQFLRLVRSA